MVDRCTQRQQTYEVALLCEDECLSVAFEIDGGENALKVNRAAKVHSGIWEPCGQVTEASQKPLITQAEKISYEKTKSRELWVIYWTPLEHTEHLPQYGREVGLRPNQATESTEQHLSFINWHFLSNFAAAVLFGSLDIFPLQYSPKGKALFPRMANARKWHDPHSTPCR